MSTDSIEKAVLLRASRSRVWKAVSDSKKFGAWFGIEFDRPFEAGRSIRGVMSLTEVHEEVSSSRSIGLPVTRQAVTKHLGVMEDA